ncbi:MAG: hypothetical protein ACK4TK_03850 [Thiobacillaceae bacterium]
MTRVETSAYRQRQRRLNLSYALGAGLLVMAYGVLMTYYLVLSPAA